MLTYLFVTHSLDEGNVFFPYDASDSNKSRKMKKSKTEDHTNICSGNIIPPGTRRRRSQRCKP